MIAMLARLAPRERWLIGLLVAVVLPLALVLGGLLPLEERRIAAEAALDDSRALAGWVQGRAVEMQVLEAQGQTGPRAPVGLSGIEQGLVNARLRTSVTELANRPGGGVALRFDMVEFAAFMDWLSGEDPGWGYDIAELRVIRGDEPGIVEAELRLTPQE